MLPRGTKKENGPAASANGTVSPLSLLNIATLSQNSRQKMRWPPLTLQQRNLTLRPLTRL
jgi:hypothetical protein